MFVAVSVLFWFERCLTLFEYLFFLRRLSEFGGSRDNSASNQTLELNLEPAIISELQLSLMQFDLTGCCPYNYQPLFSFSKKI